MPGTNKEAEKLIEDLLFFAISLERDGQHALAMKFLGRALHTIQDKYAHEEQNAGWYAHLPLLGSDPDNPQKHRSEYVKAGVESKKYVDKFIKETRERK